MNRAESHEHSRGRDSTRAAGIAFEPLSALQGEREGPIAQRWEGEVGVGKRSGIRPLTPTLSPDGRRAGLHATVALGNALLGCDSGTTTERKCHA